jgi:glycerophosphoryl diester phosphodiesterase
MDLAAGHDRDAFVEQIGQTAKDPALGLAAKSQQDEIVARENGVYELRDDGFVEPDDSGKELVAGLQLPNEIIANFLLDRTRVRARSPQVTERFNWGSHEPILSQRGLHYISLSHPFFSARQPQVFAHRGGSALAPENTLAAFDSGLALGAQGLELDVHLSADGVVVVHHDRTLDRTTNLTGPIAMRTAGELAKADAGHFFRPDPAGAYPFRGRGITIPTLAEVLARYRDVLVVVELKVNDPALARAVVGVVRQAGAIERVCLGSFGLRVLREARRLEARLATSAAREEVRWALYRSWCRWPVRRVSYRGYQVPECSGRTRVISQRFVEDAHAIGLGVQVWTVDTEADARRLLALGVDALITDRPDIIVPFVRGYVGRTL